jgi:hypothetical protein
MKKSINPTTSQPEKALRPLARRDNLVVRELPNELLIYDLDNDQAHCLNQSAALVWKNCDGEAGIADLARKLETELQAPVSEDFVWLALGQLQEFRLLEKEVTGAAGAPALSRRQLMKKLGLAAAIALPLVTSIVAPTATQAQTKPPPPPDG